MDPINLEIDSDATEALSSIDSLTAAVMALNESINNLNGANSDATDSSNAFTDALSSLGSIIGALQINDFITWVRGIGIAFVETSFQSAAALENMGITMGYLFKDQGPAIMQFIDQLTIKSGLLSKTLLEGVANQMSSLHLPLNTFEKDLTDIATVAEGAGGSVDKMNAIVQQMGNILALGGQTGVIPTLYLRQIERLGVPIVEALSKITGKPASAFKSLSKTMVITADQYVKAINLMSNTTFSGAIEAQANTLAGLFGSIQAQATSMIDSILGVSATGKTTNNSVFSIISADMKEFFGYLEAHKGQIETWFKNELQIFLDYVIAHRVDIENFFKNINKELTDFGSWISTNKQNIETMVNFISTLAWGAGKLGQGFNFLVQGAASAGTAAGTLAGNYPTSQNSSHIINNNINMANTLSSGVDVNSLLSEMMYKLNHR